MKFSEALEEYIDLKGMEHVKLRGDMPAYVSKGYTTTTYYKRLNRLQEIMDKLTEPVKEYKDPSVFYVSKLKCK